MYELTSTFHEHMIDRMFMFLKCIVIEMYNILLIDTSHVTKQTQVRHVIYLDKVSILHVYNGLVKIHSSWSNHTQVADTCVQTWKPII